MQNVVKIGDFGCSIYNQNSGLRTTVVGCLEYSSPEQLSNEGYSEKIDAWSLGILTYELLFGKSPFEKDIKSIARNKEAEAKLGELTFPAAIAIRDETKDFIENLLSEDPDKRMDMDEVLGHEFLREEMGKKPLRLDFI
jgi:serine/threonine protein kinase